MMKKIIAACATTLLLASAVNAEDIFKIDLTVGDVTQTATFSSIEDTINAVDNVGLERINAAYTNVSPADLILNIRGLPATVKYTENNSSLNFKVPVLGIEENFSGLTRDDSQNLFEDYLKSNGGNILQKMLQQLVETTAVDPVAGNPKSLMAQMGAADFSMGSDIAGGAAVKGTELSAENTFSMGLRYGSASAGAFTQDVYSIPINYTVRLDSDPRKQLIFDLPILVSDTEGAKSYAASFGLGFRFPVSDDWSITPALRAGATGSVDLGAAAIVYSGSLTSNYNLYWDDIRISMGNMVNYIQTSPIDAGDYSIDYDLTNTVFKNGIGFEGPVDYTMFGNPTSWQVDIANTLFTGDSVYIDNYTDFGVSFGTRASDSSWKSIRIGATYTVASDYDSFGVNFGYKF